MDSRSATFVCAPTTPARFARPTCLSCSRRKRPASRRRRLILAQCAIAIPARQTVRQIARLKVSLWISTSSFLVRLRCASAATRTSRKRRRIPFTVGGVFQPRFIPGLSISVDYFDIEVEDVITRVAAQTIINQCVDLPTINNPFCSLFQRNRGPRPGSGRRNSKRILEGSLRIDPELCEPPRPRSRRRDVLPP